MSTDSQAPKWISAIVGILVLLGGGATAYANLQSQLIKLQVEQKQVVKDVRELDVYDAHLERSIDALKGGAIRTEVEVGSMRKSTEELKFAMAEVLKEMRRMNDNLIVMGSKNEA